MKNLKSLLKYAFLVVFAVGIIACDNDDSDSDSTPTISYLEHLTNMSENVIVKTYEDLSGKGAALFNEAKNFQNNKSAATLDQVKQAWRSARQPWEQSEGFLYGPIDTKGIDPAIDSWPVNVVDMDALLADTVNHPTITEAVVDAQVDEAKGFHLIEYLLWGIDGNKQVADFSDRELEYLVAACENLKNKTNTLHISWATNEENYVANFTNFGVSYEYSAEKNALEDIVTGMIAIADEVGNGKIEAPLNGENGSGVDPSQEESRFSHNSKIDFSNNMKSIANIYNGKYYNDGKGISDVIASENATLDATFRQEIIDAIDAIDAIPGTFTDAIQNNRSVVEDAQEKARTVQATLESEIKPLISSL